MECKTDIKREGASSICRGCGARLDFDKHTVYFRYGLGMFIECKNCKSRIRICGNFLDL